MIDPERVAIATPIGDGKPYWQYMRSILALDRKRLFGPIFSICGCSDIVEARNRLVRTALASAIPWDQLVFIDADMGFTLEDWGYLLDDSDGAAAVCAEYSAKGEPRRKAPWPMGFCRLSRALLERLASMQIEGELLIPRYDNQDGQETLDFFESGMRGPRLRLAEDQGFWSLLSSLERAGFEGFRVRYETRTRLVHVGMAEYPYTPELPDPPVHRAP